MRTAAKKAGAVLVARAAVSITSVSKAENPVPARSRPARLRSSQRLDSRVRNTHTKHGDAAQRTQRDARPFSIGLGLCARARRRELHRTGSRAAWRRG